MSKSEYRDYYALLEIEVESDERTINKAYRLLAKKYHPDKTREMPRQVSISVEGNND